MATGKTKNDKRERICPSCRKKEMVSYKNWWSFTIKNPNTVCRRCNDIRRTKYFVSPEGDCKRNCPICKKIIYYKTLKGLGWAIKSNTNCYKCSNGIKNEKLKIYPDEGIFFIRYCPICNKKINHKAQHRRSEGVKNNVPCRQCSNKLSATQEVKDKIREKFFKRRDGHGFRFTPSYNKKGCIIFDEINKEYGWNGFHAENVGEYKVLGYYLDYYEPNQNIAIEYDERHHNEKKIKDKDNKKQLDITTHLNCLFLRIKDGQNWREVVNSNSLKNHK